MYIAALSEFDRSSSSERKWLDLTNPSSQNHKLCLIFLAFVASNLVTKDDRTIGDANKAIHPNGGLFTF